MPTLVLIWLAILQAPAPHPSTDELARRVRQALKLDAQIQKDFAYVERRRDVKVSKLGKVTIGPLRTFEVFPSDPPGRTYKRLIEIDGVPLSAGELARRDADHERDLREAAARERRESERDRAARAARLADQARERDAIIDDAVAIFAPTIVGREMVDGQPVIVADVKPRQQAVAATREGKWMKAFEGRIWIAEADSQLVKVDMHAARDVTIGWGVVGRLFKGSRVVFERRRFDGAWLPSRITYEARGKTLLFRNFQFNVTTTYGSYRRQGKQGGQGTRDKG
jgi:hypothetical protein